jgi:hypothetical protein
MPGFVPKIKMLIAQHVSNQLPKIKSLAAFCQTAQSSSTAMLIHGWPSLHLIKGCVRGV